MTSLEMPDMPQDNRIDKTIHKLRSLSQVLGGFVDYLESNIENEETKIQSNSIKEYCSIVIEALHEVEGLIEKIKNSDGS